MSEFATTEWQRGQCWKNRFCEDIYSSVRTKPACPRAGVYGQISGPESAFRWCAEHRCQSDVLIAEGALATTGGEDEAD